MLIIEYKICKVKIEPDNLLFPVIRPSNRREFVGVIMSYAEYATIFNYWFKELVIVMIKTVKKTSAL